MAIISNRLFLQVQCHSTDFLLGTCVCMDQWLNACVAVERTMTAITATRPFNINLLSAVILIMTKSQQQAVIHAQQTYKKMVRQQIQQHKRLLIAPVVLVILALPRLIMTFVSKCMKSINDSWLFLIGYFISFIPTMLTFVVFVFSSKFYKKEFHKTVRQYRTNIQRRLHLIS